MSDWTHYRTFLGVLDQGSLSGAARVLGLTQPTVARHMDELEHALGASLFTRSPQGLKPTETAQALAPHAREMQSAEAAMVRVASGAADEAGGAVRVTASDMIGVEVLPAILRDLRALHPGLTFEIAPSNEAADLLRRDADIAIRMTRPKQSALVAKKVGDIALGMHAARAYLDAHGTPRRIEDLAKHAIIGFDRVTVGVQALKAMGLSLERGMFAYRTDNDLAQWAAIRAGCGIGICQVGLARREALVRLFAKQFDFPLETWIVMHEDLRGVRRMRIVFDHLAAAMGAYAAGR